MNKAGFWSYRRNIYLVPPRESIITTEIVILALMCFLKTTQLYKFWPVPPENQEICIQQHSSDYNLEKPWPLTKEP